MTQWFVLTPEDVVFIHDRVIFPHELQGQAGDKSVAGAIARVEARVQYGLLGDVYDLAAAYGVVIATGHLFNDANKRTAFQVMRTCLDLNGVEVEFQAEVIGPVMVEVAQGRLDEAGLAALLRG